MKDREDLRNNLRAAVESYINGKVGNISVSYYDLKEEAGFSIKGRQKVQSASTIKLVIMAELLRRVRKGEISLENKITVTEDMRTGGDGILKELEPGHTFTLKEIMTLMIIVSDNEAANILIQMLGMDTVNQMAVSLGLTEAHLGRKMMDSEARNQGRDNFICADDIVAFFKAVYQGSCVDQTASDIMFHVLKRQQQSGRIQLYLPDEVEVAHKCGDLDFLENDGGIILLPGHPYILAVLTSEMESNKEGRECIGIISKLIYDTVSANK